MIKMISINRLVSIESEYINKCDWQIYIIFGKSFLGNYTVFLSLKQFDSSLKRLIVFCTIFLNYWKNRFFDDNDDLVLNW